MIAINALHVLHISLSNDLYFRSGEEIFPELYVNIAVCVRARDGELFDILFVGYSVR